MLAGRLGAGAARSGGEGDAKAAAGTAPMPRQAGREACGAAPSLSGSAARRLRRAAPKPASAPSTPRPRRRRRPPGDKPLARPRCASARAMPASICARCAAPGRPAASAMTISTRSCARAAGAAVRDAAQPTPTVEDGQDHRPAPPHRPADGASRSARIPHFTYVEEVDVTALEELRATLNAEKRPTGPA